MPRTSISTGAISESTAPNAYVDRLDAAGIQVAIHAIGDRANATVLKIFQDVAAANGPRDRRFRVEHAQHLCPELIRAFAAQGVIASMQPYHAIDDGRWAEKRIGGDRAKFTYAFKSLLDAGATLAFGSDWFVAPMDPLLGIYAAASAARWTASVRTAGCRSRRSRSPTRSARTPWARLTPSSARTSRARSRRANSRTSPSSATTS